jgi:hypothetical protein
MSNTWPHRPETVNTLPGDLEAYWTTATPPQAFGGVPWPPVLQRLPELGLDPNQATQQLEDEGGQIQQSL